MRAQHPRRLNSRPQWSACGNDLGSTHGQVPAFRPDAHRPLETVAAPLIAECWANLECRVVDTRLLNRYNFFVLEVQKAWIDPACKDPRTLHHRGRGHFMVAGETIKLASKAR